MVLGKIDPIQSGQHKEILQLDDKNYNKTQDDSPYSKLGIYAKLFAIRYLS